MISKKNIIEIINNPHLSADQLEFEYSKLNEDTQRKEFLDILKDILQNASDNEKAICFTAIDMMGQASAFESLIKSNIESINMNQSYTLISSLIWLAAAVSKPWSINFIKRIIKHFKPLKGEYSYLFNMGVNSLVSTSNWKVIVNEILWIIGNCNDEYVVDLIAYFKWKRGEHELEELFQIVKESGSLIERVTNLKLKIRDRYISSYGKLS